MKYVLLASALIGLSSQVFAAQTKKKLAVPATSQTQTATPAATTVVEVPPAKAKKDVKLSLDFRLQSRVFDDELVTSRQVGALLVGDVETHFTKKLRGRFVPFGQFFQGNASNAVSAEGNPKAGINFDEAAVYLDPSPSIALAVGVVPTQINPIQSTFEPGGIPGAYQKIEGAAGKLKATLLANQVIPAADQVQVNSANSNVDAAAMFTESVQLSLGDIEKTEWLDVSAAVARYDIQDARAGNADGSRAQGSTIIGDAKHAQFAYGFGGYEYAAQLRTRLAKWFKISFTASTAINEKAPDGSNQSIVLNAAPTFTFGNLEITPSYTRFRHESDVIPGGMGSYLHSYTNRDGTYASLSVKLIKEDVSLKGSWTQTNEIKDTPYHADRTIYSLAVGTTYDIL